MSNGTYLWPPPAYAILDYATCVRMANLVTEAMAKAVESGVQSYHIGSRSLSRYSITEMENMLSFWLNRANDAWWGGSSIRARRGIPTDCIYGC